MKWRRHSRARIRAPASIAASLLSAFPIAGQVNLLTTSSFDSPQQLVSAGNLARGAALVSLGAAAGQHGDWSVQGAMTQGDVASWMVSGSYLTRAPARHVYDLGMSYSLQRYDGSNPAALAAVSDGNRFAGLVYAFDSWTITQKVSLLYGGGYAKYGYIEKSLFSPRARLTFAPDRLAASQLRRVAACGGAWRRGIRALDDRRHVAAAGAHVRADLGRELYAAAHHALSTLLPSTTSRRPRVVGARAFKQRTDDQLVTLFGLGNVERPVADLGHYYVGTGGDVVASGWSVSIRQVIARRVRGSVDYTVTTAEWQSSPQSEIAAARLPGVIREGRERIQDVTASIDTEIPVTETHVFALYRMSDGYAGDALDEPRSAIRRALRRAGDAVAPVHGLRQRPLGNAGRRAEPVPRNRR